MFRTLREAEAIAGKLGKPSKMPGYAYGIPAKYCPVGSKLVNIPGSVCSDCYALKGRYMFKNVRDAQEKRYASLKHPGWVAAMVYMIKYRSCDFFRWHDSGDLQDMDHLDNVVRVALRCPETKFWLPTRENKLIRQYLTVHGNFPKNLVVRVSGAMINGVQLISFPNTSTVTSDLAHSTCPAPRQSNNCGLCRDCWDPQVRNVSYHKH
jgi:hypothetical protein